MKNFIKNLNTWQKWLIGIILFTIIVNMLAPEPPTPEELKAEALKKADAKAKADSIAFATKKAEILAWRKTNPKAAKIYDKHPKWSMEECTMISEGTIWVGMHYDMLKYMRGLPNSANPSNYGNGTRWQWCWHDYTPSCFYDNNDDGIIDSYN